MVAWVAVAIGAAIFLLVLIDVLGRPSQEEEFEEPLTVGEIVSAAVELDAIDHRLDVAWTCHELRGEAHRLKRELAIELKRIDALDSDAGGRR